MINIILDYRLYFNLIHLYKQFKNWSIKVVSEIKHYHNIILITILYIINKIIRI